MQSSINSSMNTAEWIMLLILSVLWGGSFFFVAIAVTELPPLTIVTLRVALAALAALALWSVLVWMSVPIPKTWQVWRAFLWMGILNNVIPFTLIVWGQTQIASGLASILNATTPFFAVIVAGLILADERMTTPKLLGVMIGFFGVMILFGPSALEGLDTHLVAQIAVLGAALSYAFAGVFGRRFKTMGVHPIMTATGQLTASSLILVPMTLYINQSNELLLLSTTVWVSIIALAILSTALAYILYFRILASAGATNLMLVTLLIPVSAILLGSLVLGETLEAVHFIGMLLIGLGLLVIDGRLWRNIRSRRAIKSA